jgi:tryptophan synthase alpha chain
MGLFLTCGFPTPESSDAILDAIAAAGADFVELGMPFSDPLAEGLPIQRSSHIALEHGIRLPDVLRSAERFRSKHDTPLVLMGYANPIHRYGIEPFCRDAVSAGVDGLILADLSLEASDFVDGPAQEAGLELVYLVSPGTPDERVSRIDARATGFVYAVAVSGLTGDKLDDLSQIQQYLRGLRTNVVSNPLLVGFGIDRHDLGISLSEHTDGFIVGSALVREIERVWEQPGLSPIDRVDAVARFVTALKFGSTEDV